MNKIKIECSQCKKEIGNEEYITSCYPILCYKCFFELEASIKTKGLTQHDELIFKIKQMIQRLEALPKEASYAPINHIDLHSIYYLLIEIIELR